MNYGFVKVAAAVPHVKVADCFYNIQQIEGLMRQASQKEVQSKPYPRSRKAFGLLFMSITKSSIL